MRAFPKPSERPRPRKYEVVDGIEYRRDKATNHVREICLTAAAKTRRRREIYDRAGGRCEGKGCGRRLRFEAGYHDSMHWHHGATVGKRTASKGMGGGWEDDSLANGSALCERCHLIEEHKQF